MPLPDTDQPTHSTWLYLLTLLTEQSGKQALCVTPVQMAALGRIHCQPVTKYLNNHCSCTASLGLAGSDQKRPVPFLKLGIGS